MCFSVHLSLIAIACPAAHPQEQEQALPCHLELHEAWWGLYRYLLSLTSQATIDTLVFLFSKIHLCVCMDFER